ncbi:MAG: endonuclease/exonuclease/phosphatase family protein [Fimbriimonas sp.]
MFAPLPPVVAEPLKVMSFNIRYGTANDGDDRWELRRPKTLTTIQKQAPDVLGLQEALAFQVEEIRKAMPHYAAVGVGREDGKAAGEHSTILYDTRRLVALRSDTFWFSDTPTVPNSMHWGNRITRVCTWAYFRDLKTGRFFWHFNLHIDHESQPSRLKSAELLVRRIRERGTDDPVVVTGDFNVGESNPVVDTVKGAGFRDSYRVRYPDAKDVGTFHGFRELGKDKIDYVFVNDGFEVTDAAIVPDKVDGRWPSDHFPVTATIEFK